MAFDSREERTRWSLTVGGVLIVLAVSNVLSNAVLPGWAYVPWNVAVTSVIVVIARREVSMVAMGFTEWRRGAVYGAVLAVLTLGVLLVGLTMPAFNEMYHDRRVGTGTLEWAYQVFIRIPLGTALLEESAFRAVLPALFAVRWSRWRAAALASVTFGVWHVLPALHLNTVNPTMTGLFGRGAAGVAAAVVFGVVGTTVAGLWWCLIRFRARSVLATIIAHVASNSIAYSVAWIVSH